MTERPAAVIDTNVLITANRRGQHVPLACTEACVDSLLAVRDNKKLALDDDGEILHEYATYCHHSGQPGPGDSSSCGRFRASTAAVIELP